MMQDTIRSPFGPAPAGLLQRAAPAFLLMCLLAMFALPGCVASSSRNSPPLGYSATPDGLPMSIRTLGADGRYAQLNSGDIAARLRARTADEPINVLALSGGGAGGAFGAGAIVGMSQSGQRPQFTVVTGVSAGALIAPYAFLGPAWDHQLTEIYADGSGEHVLQSRGLGAVFGSSMDRGTPLKELVDRYATDELIQAIAREAGKGRLLLVATTDVNTGQPVVWDLGAIAMNGGSGARTLFRDVLVASASVPGMFPPVIIHVLENGAPHDEAHVDGAATVPFFVPRAFVRAPSGSLEGAHRPAVYVIIDGALTDA